MVGKVMDDGLVCLTGASGVKIHTGDACGGELGADEVFDTFGAVTVVLEVGVFAGRAVGWDSGGISAVVASHAPCVFSRIVQSEGDVAAWATWYPSADMALDVWGVATSVVKEDDLLTCVECLVHSLKQLGRKGSAHLFAATKLADVDDFHLRQLYLPVAFGEADEAVFVGSCVVVALEGRCGGAEQGGSSAASGHEDGDVTCVVAWRGVLLLKVGLMLFVDNDEPEPLEGQEDGGADADDEVVGCVGKLTEPDLGALRVSELTVVDAHAVTENSSQAVGELGGKDDLGQ